MMLKRIMDLTRRDAPPLRHELAAGRGVQRLGARRAAGALVHGRVRAGALQPLRLDRDGLGDDRDARGPAARRRARSGRPPPHTRLAILDEDGQPAAAGRDRPDLRRPRDAVRGLHGRPRQSRDARRRDDDRRATSGTSTSEGRLFVDSREDDMIISGGENVYPGEVEEVLREHPDVDDAVVIGVEDERFGQRLVAFVVPAPGSDLTPRTTSMRFAPREPRPLQGAARGRICATSCPRNALGKVLRRELRADTAASSHDGGGGEGGGQGGVDHGRLERHRARGRAGARRGRLRRHDLGAPARTSSSRRPRSCATTGIDVLPRRREHGARRTTSSAWSAAHKERFGRMDVLMNNAGVGHRRRDRGRRDQEARHAARRQPARGLPDDARGDPDAEGGRRRTAAR